MISRITTRSIRKAATSQKTVAAAMATSAKSPEVQQIAIQSLIQEVAEEQRQLAINVVPWYLKNMPESYFRQIPDTIRAQHVKAITAIRDLKQADLSLKIESKGDNDSLQITYINSQTKKGLLHSQINSLKVPDGYELTRVNVFSSLDGELALNMFSFESKAYNKSIATKDHASKILNYIEEVKAGKHVNDSRVPTYSELYSNASMDEYLKKITPSYAENSDPRRFLIQKQLYEKVKGTEGSAVHVERGPTENLNWITIAASNVLPEVLLRLSSSIISSKSLDIVRAHLDEVADPSNSTAEIPGQITMLRLLVQGEEFTKNPEFTKTVARDLKRAKWLDNQTTQLGLNSHPELGVDKAEIITALCSMVHGPLHKIDRSSFNSIKSIIQIIDGNKQYVAIADLIASLFLERFNPAAPISDDVFQARSTEIKNKINVLQFDAAKILLNKMLEGVSCTLRTNFYNEDRYALSFRLDPSIMVPVNSDKPMPFGAIFCHGRHFNAFHNRFKDIARGGLRLVTPQNSDGYALESSRQYDEVYGLSYAQQLKNKDIPEGGSKGVILINTPALEPNTKFFAMRKAVKACTDSILDLIVKDSVKNLIDFYGKEELIYLGPDEQIIPSDIEWIIQRAGQRGYPIPAAFMSSKKDDGFNHKEFGVTSEGVNVFMDVAIRNVLKIDPKKQPFTIKITGGPDGDVAGNLMKIMYRDYGENAKLVAVADGFGVAEDPEGLDSKEILRLFEEGHPIDQFDKSKLSPKGIVLSATTEEGAARRNNMHFRVKSDVFVPAGGRPNTINGDNWHNFIDENGVPSSPLIVEGANIFNTPEARKNLFEKGGVIIVKDSSANKCGVITSSCEIGASMLLTKDEFMAVKPQLVDDVLEKLRFLAKSEGELLFKEFQNYPGALPHFSERISYAIAKVTDAIIDSLEGVEANDELMKELQPLIIESLPKKLAEIAGDRVPTRYPLQYQKNAIAAVLAAKIVYQEGIHLIETQPTEKVAERAFMYFRADQKMKKLLKDLDSESFKIPENKATIAEIIKKGGARSSLDFF